MSKKVIAYLHTHWDREWYREFEVFRIRLLRVFDNILNLLQENRIPCFYFDGQVSALEDYLEMRPENVDIVKTLVKQKKLFIGPFYCLVDEFLTDKTCFEKNLEIGMQTAMKYGCIDFLGYLPDTFGHSKNVVKILNEFGIDKCIVWRGCGDFPSEFTWCGAKTINLVRGYFNDFFSMQCSIGDKANAIETHLDKIAEKSGEYLLMPIGADHLGIEVDIDIQISQINELLKDKYEIILDSPFKYFELVEDRFEQFEWNDELRDNSKTFTLQGCYSSRLDLKRENVECTYLLDLISRLTKFQKTNRYDKLIEYAYKLLLQNQAHDSICGCSIDDVHKENKFRYKKIKQIANSIIEEYKFEQEFENNNKILNLSNNVFNGNIEFNSTKKIKDYEKINVKMGFDSYLLANTQRIPITEDYTKIYTYIAEVQDLKPDEIDFILPIDTDSDLEINETRLMNKNIKIEIIDNSLYINDIKTSIIDFIDNGDSYNNGPIENDKGLEYSIIKSKIVLDTPIRASLKIDFANKWDIIPLIISLDKNSKYAKFSFDWQNSRKNHLLEVKFTLKDNIYEVYSEDMNELIKRNYNPEYNIRENLPKERGIEVKTNTAPMQRGLLINEVNNNIGIITKGLTQYEVYKNELYIPILRATGVISNPKNPARSTPAGPPLETNDLQQIGQNLAEFNVFFGNENEFENVLNNIYSYIIA